MMQVKNIDNMGKKIDDICIYHLESLSVEV